MANPKETSGPIALDYETYLIDSLSPIPKAVCISWAANAESGIYPADEMGEFVAYAFNSDRLLIAQNAVFECLVTFQNYPHLREAVITKLERGEVFCTQLYQALIDNIVKSPSYAFGLAGLVKYYLGLDISATKHGTDVWRLRYNELDGVPLADWPQEAIDYAVGDSVFALEIYKRQVRDHSNIEFSSHLRAGSALNYFASTGILIDKEVLAVLEAELDDKLNPLYEELMNLGFVTLKKGKYSKGMGLFRKHIATLSVNHLRTGKGAIATDKKALVLYQSEVDDPIMRKFQELSKYEKAKSAYVQRLKTANPYIRTSYNPIVSSGRTSSRTTDAYPSVNIQQQPRGLK